MGLLFWWLIMSHIFRSPCDGSSYKNILKDTEKTASNMEEMMKFRDAANGKAQREKLQEDFLQFYDNEFFPERRSSDYQSPSKDCFHKKGQEFLDASSENRYLTYSVRLYFLALYFNPVTFLSVVCHQFRANLNQFLTIKILLNYCRIHWIN